MPARKIRESLPAIGVTLHSTYKNKSYSAVVVAVNPSTGKVAVRMGKDDYTTLSAAARQITNTEVNGWIFWGVESRSRIIRRSRNKLGG